MDLCTLFPISTFFVFALALVNPSLSGLHPLGDFSDMCRLTIEASLIWQIAKLFLPKLWLFLQNLSVHPKIFCQPYPAPDGLTDIYQARYMQLLCYCNTTVN
jgi:hypothetical protein